ncbi:MAG: acyloxyacyl hydrolase [Pseudomonadota bacterium]
MKSKLAGRAALILLTCVTLGFSDANAIDALLIEGGFSESDESAERFGAAVRWNVFGNLYEVGDWKLTSYIEANVTYWDGDPGRTGEDSLVDFSLTPTFRYGLQRDSFAPFVELGLGAHVHTEDGIGDKNFDVPFAFGSHFGAGARFGADNRYELVYRFQHLSNAGIGDDNPGINFHAIQLGIHF